MMKALDISSSALEAQRVRMEVVAQNLANAQTTRATQAPDGSFLPYRRRETVFKAMLGEGLDGPQGGVRVDRIQEDMSDFRLEYNPHHPHADAQGYVKLPNVDVLMEMVDLMEASRAYEANITAMDATKSMVAASMRILA